MDISSSLMSKPIIRFRSLTVRHLCAWRQTTVGRGLNPRRRRTRHEHVAGTQTSTGPGRRQTDAEEAADASSFPSDIRQRHERRGRLIDLSCGRQSVALSPIVRVRSPLTARRGHLRPAAGIVYANFGRLSVRWTSDGAAADFNIDAYELVRRSKNANCDVV